MNVVFQDPPAPRRGGNSLWADRLRPALEEIAERPGKWGLIQTFPERLQAHHLCSSLRRGPMWLPSGPWSFTMRTVAGGGGQVYARFEGRS